MFDLEQSIADWRRQMLAAGIQSPAPLEELESHLREDVQRQMESGIGADQAFDAAVRRVGSGSDLKCEFRKLGRDSYWCFFDKPIALKILAVWLLIVGWDRLGLPFWLSGLSHRLDFDLLEFNGFLFSALCFYLGFGLLFRRNFWRIGVPVYFALFALSIVQQVCFLKANGWSSLAGLPPLHSLPPSIMVRHVALGLIPVPYGVFQVMSYAGLFMWFYGLVVLIRVSVRNFLIGRRRLNN